MTDARLLSFDKVKIRARGWVRIDDRIFLVVRASGVEPAVESEKDPRVHALRKARWREDDVVGALAFVSGEGIRDGLERDQGLNAGAADDRAGAVGGVVRGETKILRHPAEVASGDEIQFVRAQGFVGVNQTVNSVILKV